jgi:hypothetical protein
MRTSTFAQIGRVGALLLVLLALFVAFLLAVRPWYLTWGATRPEAAGTLAGDEFVVASSQSTRAIDIEASADAVWPWLLQLGQDRGGFYSYEFLENLVGTEMKNVDRLDPALQHWKVGDKLWMYPPDKLAGAGHAVLLRLDPGRALVFGTRQVGTELAQPPDGTWAFVLQPLGANRARLIVRGRGAGRTSIAWRAFDRLVFEPVHFVMERKMMEGIKSRAERRPSMPVSDMLEIALFAASFALFCTALVRLVRWPLARRWVGATIAAGLAFQLLTFVQPPWILGLLVVLALLYLFEAAGYA